MIAEKLRKSILQAAIQGKLTAQLPEDGDARDLLEEIKAKKAHLVKEGKIKKEKPLLEITEEEIPFDIPENWCWVRLGEIATKVTDGSHNPPPNSGKGYPVISAQCIDNNKINLERVNRYTDQIGFEKENPRTDIKFGDIILGIIGGSIGNLARYESDVKVIAQRSIAIINSLINNDYLYLVLKSPLIQQALNNQKSGTAQGGVYLGYLKQIIIPLPPVEVQRKIVNKTLNLMEYIDGLAKDEAKLNIIKKTFPKKMRDSLLQAAIQGKLTEQLESDGDARALVADIQKEKARLIKEGKIKKEKALPEITEEEIPFEIPDNWCWVRLGCVLQVNPRNQLEDDLDVSFIPMTLISDGYNNKFTTETRKWKEIKSGFTHFSDDDVVLAKITPCFQNLKSAVMRNLTNGFGAGTTELHVLRRSTDQIDCDYLLCFLKNPLFIKDGLATMKGTAGQQRISTDFVKEYLFPLPPLAEQQRIVERLEQLLPLCDALE